MWIVQHAVFTTVSPYVISGSEHGQSSIPVTDGRGGGDVITATHNQEETVTKIDQSRSWRPVLGKTVLKVVPPTILARLVRFHKHAIPKAKWDEQWASGFWDYLGEDIGELGRFSLIAGYCHFLKVDGKVLDIGCGTGMLAERLPTTDYLGVDLSTIAIEKAMQRKLPNARFVAADAVSFVPPHSFDVIVFNESLWYLREPERQVLRYAQYLTPGGLLIVSMWHAAETIQVWKRLKAHFHLRDTVRLVHPTSHRRWDITVLLQKHNEDAAQTDLPKNEKSQTF